MATCSVLGCERHVRSRGLCSSHYYRDLRHGHPSGGGTGAGEARRYLNEVVAQYNDDACLRWPFATDGDGRGQIFLNGKLRKVQRVACEMQNGPAPSPKHEAAHSCGNGWCAAKRHLSWKTHAENMADMDIHGTRHRGEAHKNSKLTSEQVIAIRHMAANTPLSQREIGNVFGVSRSAIDGIVSGKRWTHVSIDEAERKPRQ